MSRIKVGIGVPSSGEWKSEFGMSLGYMLRRTHNAKRAKKVNFDTELIGIVGHLPEVRHLIVREAYKDDCTHLLFLDADMTFPSDTLMHLLRHNLPAVGANYPRRTIPPLPTAYALGAFENKDDGVVYSHDKEGLEEVKHIGFGCCLLDMRIFDAISTPYFMFEPAPPLNMRFRGEDVYFFEKLRREADIPVFVDHDLSKMVKHVGDHPFTWDHVREWRRQEDAKTPEDRSAA